jgi:predicted esterase
MDSPLQLFDYTFVDNKSEKTLFLLHGTGGGKSDFLFLNDALHGKYNLVGLAGNVDEHGMRRFFKRLAPGIFDQESIVIESAKFREFVAEWCKVHQTAVNQTVFLGYSNGANLLIAMLFNDPKFSSCLILLHGMLPFAGEAPFLDLHGKSLFLSAGRMDPMVSDHDQARLIAAFESSGADLVIKKYDYGHNLHHEEIADVIAFLR